MLLFKLILIIFSIIFIMNCNVKELLRILIIIFIILLIKVYDVEEINNENLKINEKILEKLK